MGSKEDFSDEKLHRVILSPYCIDKTEVTVAAYRACVQSGRCGPASPTVQWDEISAADKNRWSQFCTWDKPGMEQHPINCVDWYEARAFCDWTGGRLPAEAEWEFAARGTDGRKYPWGGQDPDASRVNACGSECSFMAKQSLNEDWPAMYKGNDGWSTTAPVGSFPKGASAFGVLDMSGNVWEWTTDRYALYSGEDQRDPQRIQPESSPRAIRGGGWSDYNSQWIRAAVRGYDNPGVRDRYVGFRCARGAKK
jgi:formylglycine-generating enzyme required for sulfatase activity